MRREAEAEEDYECCTFPVNLTQWWRIILHGRQYQTHHQGNLNLTNGHNLTCACSCNVALFSAMWLYHREEINGTRCKYEWTNRGNYYYVKSGQLPNLVIYHRDRTANIWDGIENEAEDAFEEGPVSVHTKSIFGRWSFDAPCVFLQ